MSMPSCSGCWVVTVWLLSTLVSLWLLLILVLWGYKATPLWAVRVPLCVGGCTLHQGGRCLLVPLPDTEGYLPITSPMFSLANHDPVLWVVTLVSRFTIQLCIYEQWHHSLSQMHICPLWCLQPCHVTCGLHPSSVDAPMDIHGRSCNFLLIHPREVLLAGHWVTALPIFSCGIISSFTSCGGGLAWGDAGTPVLYAWQMPIYKGMPTPEVGWEEVSFGGGCMTFCIGPSLRKRGCLSWSDSTTSHVSSSHLSLIFLFPLKAICLH